MRGWRVGGSWLWTASRWISPEGVIVRVVEYEVANRDSDQLPGPIRLITTLADPAEVTATEPAAAYQLPLGVRDQPRRDRNPPARQLPAAALTDGRDTILHPLEAQRAAAYWSLGLLHGEVTCPTGRVKMIRWCSNQWAITSTAARAFSISSSS